MHKPPHVPWTVSQAKLDHWYVPASWASAGLSAMQAKALSDRVTELEEELRRAASLASGLTGQLQQAWQVGIGPVPGTGCRLTG